MTTDLLSALVSEPDEEHRWDVLRDFVRRETPTARAVGEEGLASEDARTRQVAADLLGIVASLDQSLAPGIADVLMPLLGIEQDADALDAVIVSLGHAGDPRARDLVLSHAGHADENIRLAVAWTLPCLGLDERALDALRRLSADRDEDVRNWATFGLAQSEATDPATIDALAARTDDEHEDTRIEGIYGLARRKDPRARPLVERELSRGVSGTLIERALEELNA